MASRYCIVENVMGRLGLGAHERTHKVRGHPMISEHIEKRLKDDPTPYDPEVMQTVSGMCDV